MHTSDTGGMRVAPRRAAGVLSRRRELWALAAVLLLAAAAYAWDLDRNGWGNAYYSAAAQAGSTSWRAMFFGSLETGNAVATDKPPLALWVMAASVRLWGLSPVSVFLPQVVMALLSVLLLHRTVRRLAGPKAALMAATVLATTPVFFVLARFNDPDTPLTLLVLAAAWCVVRSAGSTGRGRAWAVAAGALVGAAFLTKWLAALLPVPALVAYLVRSPALPLRERWLRVGAALAAATVSGLWWPLVMWALPAHGRPFEDASGGSVWNLVLGRNGVSRLVSAAPTQANPVSGAPGPLRLLVAPFDAQVGWLIPLALAALLLPVLLPRLLRVVGPAPRRPHEAYLLWGGWLLVSLAAFSLMTGPMHPYYTVLLTPAVAALVGMAAARLHDAWDQPRARLVSAALVVLTGGYALLVPLARLATPRWLTPVIAVSLVAAVGLLLLRSPWSRGRLARAAAASTIAVSLLLAPTWFAVSTLRRPVTGANPLAGPATEATVPRYDPAVVAFLDARPARTWLAAVPTATAAARLQLQAGRPVLPLGGFTGYVNSPTTAQVRAWVRQGRLRYIVLAGPYASRPGSDPAPFEHTGMVRLVRWARAHGCVQRVPGSSVQVIDLAHPCSARAARPA